MVSPGTPEWDALVAEGWVLSEDEMAKLVAGASGNVIAGAQGQEPATRRDDRKHERVDEFKPTYTERELASEELGEVAKLRRESGMPPILNRRGSVKIVAVRISEEAHAGLKEVSASFGWLHGGDGNVTALMEAIGQGKLVVRYPDA